MHSFSEALAILQQSHEDELRYLGREYLQDLTEAEAEAEDLRARVLQLGEAGTPEPAPAPPASSSRADAAAEAAVARWQHVVQEPPGKHSAAIDLMIRSCGWTYSVASKDVRDARKAAGQPNPNTYRVNGDFSWCGVFVGDCWKQAGIVPLALPASRDRYARRPLMVFSSCYRLVNHWAKGTDRVHDHGDVRRGDIVIVGAKPGYKRTSNSKAAPSWGSHVTMALGGASGGKIPTVEGNAQGGPEGARYEGVICRTRPLKAADAKTYRVLWVLRPVDADFPEGS